MISMRATIESFRFRRRNLNLSIVARIDFILCRQSFELILALCARRQMRAHLICLALVGSAIEVSSQKIQTFITLHGLNPHIRTDSAPHLDARAMQIRLQLRNRETSDLGNLFVAALMKNLQRKNHPLIIVKSRQRTPNYSVQFPV